VRPDVDLLDVNVWIALTLEDHAHHQRARHYWQQESLSKVAFCRQTSLSLMRLLTQPAVTHGDPLTPAEAWNVYRSVRQLPEVMLLDEPQGCEDTLQRWAVRPEARPRLWTDAYLAAFAQSGNLRLVTFDRDFSEFPDLDWLLLAP
jgi:toxin-antitoxin system PIN domain toxin